MSITPWFIPVVYTHRFNGTRVACDGGRSHVQRTATEVGHGGK